MKALILTLVSLAFFALGTAMAVENSSDIQENNSSSQSQSSDKSQEQKSPADSKDEKSAPQEPPQEGSSSGLIIL